LSLTLRCAFVAVSVIVVSLSVSLSLMVFGMFTFCLGQGVFGSALAEYTKFNSAVPCFRQANDTYSLYRLGKFLLKVAADYR
jgi:hypothetical protein